MSPTQLICSQQPNCIVSITFASSSFVLTCTFSSGLVEATLFFKLPLEEEEQEEDNTEETREAGFDLWVGGVYSQEHEQLKRMIVDETTALVNELKEEWISWREMPFSPPLVQFKPGFYLLQSSEVNWPAAGAFNPMEINYDSGLDFKFLVCPKVKPFFLSLYEMRSQVVSLTVRAGYVKVWELPPTTLLPPYNAGEGPLRPSEVAATKRLIFSGCLEEKEGIATTSRTWHGDRRFDMLLSLEEGGLMLTRAMVMGGLYMGYKGAARRRRKGAYRGLNVITFKMLG